MYNTLDLFGNEIKAGDVIIYNVKQSTSITTRLAIVRGVIDKGEGTYGRHRYQLKVTAYDPTNYTFDYIDGKPHYRQEPRIYNTQLYSNDNIIKLNSFTFPIGFKELLQSASVV